jgi:ABC-type multidrug transport system ATPase subunit
MVIRTEGLSFNFGKQAVVKSLALQVPEGSIYGFLGPNGAGKTTTIKLLLNLLKIQSGSIHIFEQDIQQHRSEILSQIGSLIEQPAIYQHLSGKENLLNRALLLQVPAKRVDEMLTLVQLTNAADKKAGQYSLGMKQRPGFAQRPKTFDIRRTHQRVRSQRHYRDPGVIDKAGNQTQQNRIYIQPFISRGGAHGYPRGYH